MFNFKFFSMISYNSAFEQDNLDIWRYINSFIIIIVIIIIIYMPRRYIYMQCDADIWDSSDVVTHHFGTSVRRRAYRCQTRFRSEV